ncbi:basement membrane-specific heparan sulfate proteoglycan core protein isoform X4 [Planococcus citri]|uniref:basement membrane-specific heparan sulfate proteoglycan core protein isoform X4 n=1 Tax=Planococcus citri TaxID=170843 RepID=UPI0031F92448
MRNPAFKASIPNRSLFRAKMNTSAVLFLAACLLLLCGASSASSSLVSQNDNDLVFEEEELQVVRDLKLNNSSQGDSDYPNAVSLDNDISINTRNDRKSYEEPLSERISQRFDRFKRDLGDWFRGLGSALGVPTRTPNSDEPSTGSTLPANTFISTTRQKRQSAKPDPENVDDDEEEGNGTSTEEVDPEDPDDPTFSGSSTTIPTSPMGAKKSHFRVYIKLMEAYTYDFNDHSSSIFKEYELKITTGVKEIFSAPDFVSARLVAILITTDLSQSKAVVDLEFSSAESREQVEGTLSGYLAGHEKIGTLAASPISLYVRDFGDKLPFQCSPTEIPCRDSDICIPSSGRCDKTASCPDNTDEEECPDSACLESEFFCDNGCVSLSKRCNGIDECDDRTDEKDCPLKCNNDTEFECDGRCESITKRCDNNKDCNDGADEAGCTPPPPICRLSEIECDGGCSPKCNGIIECSDGRDETGCPPTPPPPPKCSVDEFECDGHCVPASARCNGIDDCSDRRDETGCPTPPPRPTCSDDEFECDGHCVPASARCNGIDDCSDRRDEAGCPPTPPPPPSCRTNEIGCDGRCIPASAICDGTNDCNDGRDEIGCTTPSTTSTTTTTTRPPPPPPPPTPSTTTPAPSPPAKNCDQGEFQCLRSKKCISFEKKCDQTFDCETKDIIDKSDESNCPCNNSTEFTCKDGQCIGIIGRCDNLFQCGDRSDEENCSTPIITTPTTTTSTTTTPTSTTTTSTTTTPTSTTTTSTTTSSSTTSTPTSTTKTGCRPDQITCYDGACIDGRQRCDKVKDCSQGEDEEGCPTGHITSTTTLASTSNICSNIEFSCNNGICISDRFRCDGFPDCIDNSDEENCPTYTTPSPPPPTPPIIRCNADEFRCDDSHCIPNVRRCDDFPDCRDGSDEANCVRCQPDEFQCDDRHCVPTNRRCDGFPDCRDRSDESGCTTTTTSTTESPSRCLPNEFRCDDNHCIAGARRCDGYPDCRDASDEVRCTGPPSGCGPNLFTCTIRRQCVPIQSVCNNRTECFDGTDEANCPISREYLNLRAYPTDQIIKQSQEVVFQCRDEGPLRVPVTWVRGGNQPLPASSRINEQGRLEIPNIQLSHSGTYICRAVEPFYSRFPRSEITVFLSVEAFVPITARPIKVCRANESTCLNGDCIPTQLVCDGRVDCSDGSDEVRCPNGKGCEPDQFTCDNNMCIQKNWRCDGENDCRDGSDERGCEPSPPGSPCRYDEFHCTGNVTQQCIPKSFQCDDHSDCFDGTDEVGCAKVEVIQPPPPLITIDQGGTFNITCTVYGVPTPLVVWRLNWGHVPSKCTSTSVNGVGVLTCPNIEPQDAGAYSCEGINSKGFLIVNPNCILVVRPYARPQCPPGQFNDLARDREECINCFCFGATTVCQSANLYVYELQPPITQLNQLSYVSVSYSSAFGEINFNPNELIQLRTSILGQNSFRVQGLFDPSQSTYPYFSFLSAFRGNQLKSYGGYIRYNIRYDTGSSVLDTPVIIISGSGNKIFYNGTQYFTNNGTQLISTRSEQVSARLFYGSWFKEGYGNNAGGDQPSIIKPTLATREDIMTVLVNIDQIVLKLQYTDSRLVDTVISNFNIDSASASNYGLGQAAYVEQCSCPLGYTGLSCESCSSGYTRTDGGYIGRCVPTPIDCAPGSYGNPAIGIPCQPCACPSSNPTNQFGRTCYLDSSDRQLTCQCPPGYIGRRCERCAPGYSGNPLLPGDYCKPALCNPDGSADLSTGPPCNCKPFVTGERCDRCRSNSFHLASTNPYGCISCFCMGVTSSCSSSSWYRQVIATTFIRNTEDFKIVRRQDIQRVITEGLEVRASDREIVYSSFSPSEQSVYYWLLPQRYLGDKVTSYGGVLNYTLRYVPLQGDQISRNNAPDVEIISGNEIRLLYFKPDRELQPNGFETVSVPLFEQYWQREDGQPAGREYFLMALAGLNNILIKATYTTTTSEVGLQSVVLETAEERNTGLRPAYEVEECRCPPGYRGLSCQECDAGYTRIQQGLYLGLCERCNCFGHSQDCDADTGTCLNCANFTTGPDCGTCQPGYTGNPKSGEACRPVTEPNYCNCDPRGISQQGCPCNCKPNVIENNCGTCRPGTFDLQESHRAGCLECWCSGLTNQCQSSNLFVTQIPMPILDGNHGFTLSLPDRRPFPVSRFDLDIAQNKIGFDYTIARGQRLYWSLPSQFTGNKLSSYGGNLTWTQGYSGPSDAVPFNDIDLIIYGGDGVNLFWTSGVSMGPGVPATRSAKLEENEFTRLTTTGSRRASRADLLRVLSSIDAILIRTSFRSQTSYVFISDVSMDTAVSQPFTNVRATQVESCRCPTGYRGLSCESCQTGYYLDDITNQGKQCRKCPCNGREESCSLGPNAQISCKCLPGYSGNYCEDSVGVLLNIKLSPLKIIRPIGSRVTFTCSYESSERLFIRFVKNYTTNNEILLKDTTDLLMSQITYTKLEGQKSVQIVIEPNLQFIICQVVDENGLIFGTINAKIFPDTPTLTPRPVRCNPDEYECRDGHCIPFQRRCDGFADCRDRTDELNCPGGPGSTPDTEPSTSTEPNQPKPSIVVVIREPAIQIVALGTTIRYNCRAQSAFTGQYVIVKWSKEDGILPPARSVDDGNGNLVVINAQTSDTGTYVCTAYDNRTYVSQRVYLTVGEQSAPRVSLVPTGSVTLFAGQSLSVSCEASGVPVPTVEFGRSPGSYANNRKSGLRNTVFNIQSVRKSDEGIYYCRANNSVGYDSQEIVVYVNDIGSQTTISPPGSSNEVRVTVEPSEFIGSSGDQINLQCTVSANIPYRIIWTRYPDLPLQQGINERDGRLFINSASQQDSGVYVCSAISEQTGIILSRIEVNVNVAPSRRPALLTIEPERQTVAQGTLAKISCIVGNDPNARVTWRKANENLPAYFQQVGNELQIPQVDVKDRGVYVCELNYGDGNILQVHSILEVQRREAPAVEIYPKDRQTVFIGGTALIQCRVSRGEPSPTLTWSRTNNQQLSSHVETLDGGVLRFSRITEEDEGQYICTASNLVGSVTSVATLELISPPIITLNPRGPYIVPLGQSVRIECTARGRPAPAVFWLDQNIENSPLENGSRPLLRAQRPQTAVFEIYRARLADSKTYTCVADNSAGRVEEKIVIIVQEDDYGRYPPQSSIAPDEEIIFPLGTTATLRCNVGSSNDLVNVQWVRENGDLPDNHRIYNADLIIYGITRSNAGKYTCVGIGNDNAPLFSKSINLRVTGGPPKISLNPAIQTVRPGDNANVECTAEGDQPIAIQWTTKTGAPFTRSTSTIEGRLMFRGITVNDAGQYVCTARNTWGEAEAVAEVQVSEIIRPTRPTIKAPDHVQNTYEGQDIELKCVVDIPRIRHQVTWRREHGALPRTSQVLGETLRLINIRAEDADRYICEISSASGISSDFIDVQVERTCLPDEFRCNNGQCILKVLYCDTIQHCNDNSDEIECHKYRRDTSNISLNIESNKDPIKIGDSVTLLCNAIGDVDGNLIWSKPDGSFESNVRVDRNVLRIADVQPSNRGVYRCSAYTSNGINGLRSADYTIEVQLADITIPNSAIDIKTAKYGQHIDLDCSVSLEPPVNYSWIVHTYDKSLRRIVNSDKISVHNLTVDESGLYTCSARNGKTTFNIPRALVVTEVIPAFSRNSYLTLRPLVNADNNFEIEITFRPKADSGLILYSGEKNDGTGDYISFGLNFGTPEFRFDVGSGPAVIRGVQPLSMNTWHTVRLIRDKREGYMEINKRENYTGSSPGSFERLDLKFPLFIGGLPTDANYNNSGFVSGFEGCVNMLLINNRVANLKKEMIGANNLEDCDNCRINPCQHSGVCQQTLTPSGYTCICLPGYSGDNCELAKEICYLDSCGTGTCVENENGIDCRCPLGKTGKKCEKSINIETPAFLKNSWLAYQAPLLKKRFRLVLKLKPLGESTESYVDDGLIFYIAENEDGSGDYISLSISSSFAELKFKISGRDVALRSDHYLVPHEEVQVNITMTAAQAMFSVGNAPAVAQEFNPRAESAELKLYTPLYVGGYDKYLTKLPDDLLVRNGFHGCISMLDVSGTNIKMLQSSISSSNVNDCYSTFGDICRSKMPCQNGGICKTTRDTYKCDCAFSFSGTNCERQKDMCEIMNNPCQNNAKCVGTSNSLKCYCDLGFTGEHCERRINIEDSISVNGDGYIELPGSLLPHYNLNDLTVVIYFTTRASEGLLLWHGQNEKINGRNYDYFAIGISNGYVELAYKSNDVERTLRATDHRVNDGKPHTIRAIRRMETISFELDSVTSELATLESKFEIRGDIFVGGTPNPYMTGNLYRRGFVGCIHALYLQNQRQVHFGTEAKSARNVGQCSTSSFYETNAIDEAN